jgi:2-succinyl-6-hydroxy-2,4-cyclohexadiene-1-carboxylate synthase
MSQRSPSLPVSILALHGFTGSGKDFIPLQKTRSGSQYNWICPDFAGHGESPSSDPPESYQLSAALDLVDQARKSAPDPDRVILLGYSMGGRIALHYLLDAGPLPAFLIGSSPGLQTRDQRNARILEDQKWIDLLNQPDPIPEFCRQWENQSLIEPQTRLAEPLCSQLAQRRRHNNPAGLVNSLLACGTGALPSLWDKLPKLPPVNLIHGSADSKFAEIAQRMNNANSTFKIHCIPGCGHAPHLENPQAVMQVLGF